LHDTRTTREGRTSVADLLADELEQGLSVRLACMKVGVSEAGIYRWRRLAREGDDEAIQLVRKLSAAQARGARKGVDKVWAAAEEGDTRAIIFLLERVYPQDFGPVTSRPAAEYISIEEPDEQKDDQLAGYGADDRVQELARIARTLGFDKLQPDGTMAPSTPQQAPTLTAEQKRAHKRELIRVSLFTALNGHDEGRDREDTVAIVKASTGCDAIEVKQAATYLGVEDVQQSRWPNVRVVWKLPAQHRRTTPNESGRHGFREERV
jgi:hypothetical protein